MRRIALVLVLAGGVLGLTAVPAAAAVSRPTGRVDGATWTSYANRLLVSGWAYDPAASSRSIVVRVYADGRYVGQTRAEAASPKVDSTLHISGRHSYVLSATVPKAVRRVTIASVGAHTSAPLRALATNAVVRVQPPAAGRIVAVAKSYVGRARYVEGGASPKTGFDCSGYTRYVYAAAHVATLPHNAEAQRRLSRMHRVSAAHAAPGDLVFYLSGGRAYHVAIYAGHHKQYAAATPRDGIRYQDVWSSNVVYGHFR